MLHALRLNLSTLDTHVSMISLPQMRKQPSGEYARPLDKQICIWHKEEVNA